MIAEDRKLRIQKTTGTSTSCSRSLPLPLRLWSKKGTKVRLEYVIYPGLISFRMACRKCKFRKIKAGKYYCLIEDKDFGLKYYGKDGKQTWVGTVPPTLRLRYPQLYQDAVEYINGGARSFRERASSGVRELRLAVTNKARSGAGKDLVLCGFRSKPDSFDGIEKPLDEQSS